MTNTPRIFTEADVDTAIAGAFGRTPKPAPTPPAGASRSASEAAVDAAVARAFGRDTKPPATTPTVAQTLAAEAQTAQAAAPWRDALPWDERTALLEAEERLGALRVSRLGETPAAARQAVETALREAWNGAPGFGATADRLAAVRAALALGNAHVLRAQAPTGRRAPGVVETRPPARPRGRSIVSETGRGA